ncbi:hypothetical protein TKK_0010407 [Trichogramma kaykai]
MSQQDDYYKHELKDKLQSIKNVDARRKEFCFHIDLWEETDLVKKVILLEVLNSRSLFPSFKDKLYILKFALNDHSFRITKLLRENNLNIYEVIFEDGNSVLHYLAELEEFSERNLMTIGGTMELIKFFVKDSDKNYIDEHGYSYFQGACMAGDVEAVNRFITEGVDVNFDTWKCSALLISVQYKHKDIVQFSLENGANPN